MADARAEIDLRENSGGESTWEMVINARGRRARFPKFVCKRSMVNMDVVVEVKSEVNGAYYQVDFFSLLQD